METAKKIHNPRRSYVVPQPLVTRTEGEHVLRNVALPYSSSDEHTAAGNKGGPSARSKSQRRAKILASTQDVRGSLTGGKLADTYNSAAGSPTFADEEDDFFDALEYIETMDTTTLTNRQAENMSQPHHVYDYTWSDVSSAVKARLVSSVSSVPWNDPHSRSGWDKDLRFLGEWWLTLRDPSSTVCKTTRVGMGVVDLNAHSAEARPRKGEVNRPLLFSDERVAWAEDQLVADLTLRMHERLYRLDTFHIDELAMTPDRMHVLMIAGVFDTYRREKTRLINGVALPAEATVEEKEEEGNGGDGGDGEDSETSAQATSHAPTEHTHVPSAQVNSIQAMDSAGTGSSGPYSATQNTDCVLNLSQDDPKAALLAVVGTSSSPHNEGTGPSSPSQKPARVATEFILETLSFAACDIGTASALVLLSSLAVIADEHGFADNEASARSRGSYTGGGASVHLTRRQPLATAHGGLKPIINLNLSYNELTAASLHCLTMLLPSTHIRRLSLRGNNLNSLDGPVMRDFLIKGCRDLEELDLANTRLSVAQVCTFIEALPALRQLRVLNLDNIEIPPEKAIVFTRAVINSQLVSISLRGSGTAGPGQMYVSVMQEACERRNCASLGQSLGEAAGTTSFFENFFQSSVNKGWAPPEQYALPDGYGPYTNNDPSLYRED